jgi:hypothetical protein
VTEAELRQAVRHAYDFACGYCGVREEDAGSLLELDHFKPRSAGGGDELENLVYCCPTCNRLKGDFWRASTDEKRLLHPQRDDVGLHLLLQPDGLFTALATTGEFHLSRLRLNRPPLVALRRARAENSRLREALEQAHTAQESLQKRLVSLDQEIERITEELTRFLGE